MSVLFLVFSLVSLFFSLSLSLFCIFFFPFDWVLHRETSPEFSLLTFAHLHLTAESFYRVILLFIPHREFLWFPKRIRRGGVETDQEEGGEEQGIESHEETRKFWSKWEREKEGERNVSANGFPLVFRWRWLFLSWLRAKYTQAKYTRAKYTSVSEKEVESHHCIWEISLIIHLFLFFFLTKKLLHPQSRNLQRCLFLASQFLPEVKKEKWRTSTFSSEEDESPGQKEVEQYLQKKRPQVCVKEWNRRREMY